MMTASSSTSTAGWSTAARHAATTLAQPSPTSSSRRVTSLGPPDDGVGQRFDERREIRLVARAQVQPVEWKRLIRQLLSKRGAPALFVELDHVRDSRERSVVHVGSG